MIVMLMDICTILSKNCYKNFSPVQFLLQFLQIAMGIMCMYKRINRGFLAKYSRKTDINYANTINYQKACRIGMFFAFNISCI